MPGPLSQQALIILYLPLEAELHDEKRKENSEIKDVVGLAGFFSFFFLNK